ncbi:hypothetical protein [Legionella sp. CNM-4043-24]|uniref:hypothetical protein n=1 Tax=Legionella sp. CNM-4043-24 TaxID=3421646 RepID=UPI00403AB125
MTNYDVQPTEKYTNLSLLPYSASSQLINKQQKLSDLYLMKTVMDSAITALKTFIDGDLAAFDAQVGENLCQIRAYKILLLAKKWLAHATSKTDFQGYITQLCNQRNQLERIIIEWEQAIKQSKAFNKNLDGSENIIDFFARHGLIFDINEDILFIISCRFLTHFNIRDNNIPVAINLPRIASEYSVSKYRAKRLAHHYQQLVCKFGCDFIINIAHDLPKESNYTDVLPSLYKIADEDRAVLPCFVVSEIIFNHAIQEELPVLLIVNRFKAHDSERYDVIHFLMQGDDSEFSLLPCNSYLAQHCLVVSGEVYDNYAYNNESPEDYINRVLTENPLKLILANTSIHPQYSGKKLEAFRDNPFHSILSDCGKPRASKQENELIAMQNYAMASGCSKQNPSTYFLKHVYANTIANEINKLESNYTGCAFVTMRGKTIPTGITGQIYDKKGFASFQSL